MKNVNTLYLGDYTLYVKETSAGSKVAKLSKGTEGGVVEFERTGENAVRIKEMNVGSAHITVEHLALLLHHAGLGDTITDELNKIKARQNG